MRSRSCRALGVSVVAAVLVAAWSAGAFAATHAVSVKYPTFTPAALTIKVGDKVTWTNNDSGIYAPDHTVTSDDGHSFDSGNIAPGAGFSFTFTKAGTFAYHCNIHSNMHGSVTVQGASTPLTPTPTPTHSRTPTPRATATAKPTAPASPTPTRSVKPSLRASHTSPASTSAMPTPTSSRIVATGATSSTSWGLVSGIVAIAIALIGVAGFAVRRRRTVR